jgi:hypothetical protein
MKSAPGPPYPREHVPAPDVAFNRQFGVSCLERVTGSIMETILVTFPIIAMLRGRLLIPPRHPSLGIGRVLTWALRDSGAVAIPFGAYTLSNCALNTFFGRSSLEHVVLSGGIAGAVAGALATPVLGARLGLPGRRLPLPLLGAAFGGTALYVVWSHTPHFHERTMR